MDKEKTPAIFKGFWLAVAKIITLMCINFSLIINNVSLLPSIQSSSVRFVFAATTMFLGISIVYFSLRYSFTEVDKLKSEDLRTKK